MSCQVYVHALLHFGGGLPFEYIMDKTNEHCFSKPAFNISFFFAKRRAFYLISVVHNLK